MGDQKSEINNTEHLSPGHSSEPSSGPLPEHHKKSTNVFKHLLHLNARVKLALKGYRFPLFLGVILVLAVLIGQTTLNLYHLSRVLPNVWAWGVSWGGASQDELLLSLSKLSNEYANRSFVISAGTETHTFTAQELGIAWQPVLAATALYDIGHGGNFWRDQLALVSSYWRKRDIADVLSTAGVSIDRGKLVSTIGTSFAALRLPQDADLTRQAKGDFIVVPAQDGLLPDLDGLAASLRDSAKRGEVASLVLQAAVAAPEISTAKAEQALTLIQSLQAEPVVLKHNKHTWSLSFRAHADWIEVNKEYNRWQEPYLAVTLAEQKVKDFLRRDVLAKVAVASRDVTLKKDKEGKLVIEGVGIAGVSVDAAAALQQLYREVPQGRRAITLQSEIVPAHVKVAASVTDDLGIKQLIAEGESDFKGSPPNRIHNIITGMARFNNVLVPPGATFSFGEQLGRVDDTTGYKKELVIKEGGKETIPEYGGGICQVSTTLFRAALNGGLPIKQRHNHSYAVTYYNPPGLDSTVYPPTVDLKFVNDTPSYIMIQTIVDAARQKAYYNFYGTPDGRRVEMTTTGKYNIVSAAEPILEPTAELPPGVKKLKPHGAAKVGYKVRWDRKIYMTNGEVREDSFSSQYRAFPAYYWIGQSDQGNKQGV